MKIARKSQLSGKLHVMELDVTEEMVQAFEKGTMVQDAFPHLTPDEREFILSGITPEEWTQCFGSSDEDLAS
jgi:uncharacterized protein YdeI (YjbR/CyaY-like superfamily)